MTTSTDPSHMDEKQAPPNPRIPAPATIPLSPQRPKEKKMSSIPIPATGSDDPNDPKTRIRVGIAAMDKKAKSKPMAEILSRLDEKLFHVIFFGDDTLLNQPVDLWPVCDALIAFYSNGYPLDKARKYAALNNPLVLNDLEMQEDMKDRRKVYDLLQQCGIDVPKHVFLSLDGYVSTGIGAGDEKNKHDLEEHDDHIEINGVQIHKPFVEKPIDADDHNIAIYYPSSAGGGCKKLFRKIGNRSSEFYPDINQVRRDGSYIYEEFVETQGTDVKMYTVGPEYGHAEARKSPTVDGKVERNKDGKEVRFPVILTLREKEIARRIVLGFKQFVCGFDLLRVQEGDSLVSYVCDVNGWSFVKKSRKYYDDCAQILQEQMLASIKPEMLSGSSTSDPMVTMVRTMTHDEAESLKRLSQMLLRADKSIGEPLPLSRSNSHPKLSRTLSPHQINSRNPLQNSHVDGAVHVREIPGTLASEPASIVPSSQSSLADEIEGTLRASSESLKSTVHEEELRCVIAITRHGDRTPKQKLKLETSEPRMLEYFHTHTKNCRKDLKVKERKLMIEFLETTKAIISEKAASDITGKKDMEAYHKIMHMRDVLERWKIVGLNRKLQMKPKEWGEFEDGKGDSVIRCTAVQLILKWGGNLTKLGERQSIRLGQTFRHKMYPDAQGGGILRLHSTFRHDLKIKTSDEGRVMKTAAAFAKGLLELEGEIPPILVSLVHKEKESIHMLDPSGNKEVKRELDACKERVNYNLQRDIEFSDTSVAEHEQIVGPKSLISLHKALREVGNPRKILFKIRDTIGELIAQYDEMLGLMASGDENELDGEGLAGDEHNQALSGVKLYKGETLLELTERWRFIYDRLYNEDKDLFDLSRIPDVHDNVRFDMLHNPHLGLTATLEKLYNLAKMMADCAVPQEYGTTIAEKTSIGTKMCRALLEKIKFDLLVARTDSGVDMRFMINMDYGNDLPITTVGRRIRTRLYFTSESHLHTLLNVLRFCESENIDSPISEEGKRIFAQAKELCYLTQITFRLFEDTNRRLDDPRRYRVEVLFSPGATATPMHMAELDRDLDSSRFDTVPLKVVGRDNLTCQEVEDFLDACIAKGHTEEDEHDAISMGTTVDEWKRRTMTSPSDVSGN
mmetsp:Transcript_19998/g.30056  ORF Transcript_19998/g.30056 Transcript_19998/m.30056 type:complete len:1132 (-) Transcript_19998:526-3921(-)